MAVFTSQATGNWSASSTWTPSGVPALHDSVIIASPNVVTIDVNSTVGDGSPGAVNVNTGSTLSIADQIILRVYGGVIPTGQIQFGTNSAIDFMTLDVLFAFQDQTIIIDYQDYVIE